MAWSDAARAAALEARRVHRKISPDYGKPMTAQRNVYLLWEMKNIVRDKRFKLRKLLHVDPSKINWDRQWEPDTRVRSITSAKREISEFTVRLKERRKLVK